METDFGTRLRFHRLQTSDPFARKPLTQQRLGELLGAELNRTAYTGAAVSDWERGNSRIDVDDRTLLVSLVKILTQYGGIKTPGEANRLLEAGNYRALNPQERESIFPGEAQENDLPAPAQNSSNAQFLLGSLNFVSPAEYQFMLAQAKQGPDPYWPRLAVALTRRVTDNISARGVFRALIWLWLALGSYLLLSPSYRMNFQSREEALFSLTLYAAGALLIPALIAALTKTKDNVYWIGQGLQTSAALRLYTHQGAYVGFHVGYFFLFFLTPVQVFLGLGSAAWIDVLKTVLPLLVGYASAHLVPYNLWLAYGRLHLKDGGIFFIFALLGPLWAWFFFDFYTLMASPLAAGVVILIALTIMILHQTTKRR